MIDADTLCFPNNVVDVIAQRALDTLGLDGGVIKVPVDTGSPDETVAIIPATWEPTGYAEMGKKPNQFENSLQTYSIMIQTLISDMDEERAIRRHSLLSTMVRRMLYRDPVLLGALTGLRVETDDGIVEATMKYGVRSQRFLVNQKDGSFQYLSVIQFDLETQTR